MNILLLEPGYKNKFPPLGLMKLSTFHKEHDDNVVFSKGEDLDLLGQSFDRIYINSLFTFEWATTRKAIEFAYGLTSSKQNIFLGGITATIMPDFVRSQAPDINIVSGLLDKPGKIDIRNDEIIDSLAPDYSILSQIDYEYQLENDYMVYSTRGCGMNCSFCAVQKLEPIYIDYICIKKQINDVCQKNGKKCNLLLMDNNVLKSSKLEQIIQDIIDLGFSKGAKFYKPNSKRPSKRYVDFNQGLDANFLTKDKAALLAKIELRPVRIAFDHITQTEQYIKAIKLCFDAGLRHFSNYILYNSDAAIWKGSAYNADTPADLYTRLKINVDLCKQLQQELLIAGSHDKVNIYSFPMRYIPLTDTKRGYVGTLWNKKYLRAIQVFCTPTQGKGVSSKKFFDACFGRNLEEFLIFIDMPENIITRRGIYIENKNYTAEERTNKMAKAEFNYNLVQEWRTLYDKMLALGCWSEFAEKYLYTNRFKLDTFSSIQDPLFKEMYTYYLSLDALRKSSRKLSTSDREFMQTTFIKANKYLSAFFDDSMYLPY